MSRHARPTTEDPVLDLTGRVAYTGDQPHPYRTNTRFRKVDGEWQPITEAIEQRTQRRWLMPEERANGRAQAASRAKAEKRDMAKISRAIAKRQDIGNPSIVQSRSEDFPLIEALRRDGQEALIKVVRRYRSLVALCEAEPLKGLDYSKADGGEIVRESKKLTPEADIDEAAASKWTDIPDGELKVSTKIKKSKGAYPIPSRRTVVAANDNLPQSHVIRTESLHVKLTDEVLNEHIDAKPVLAELRTALGPLVEPFEDAVLGGKTYDEVGRLNGSAARYSLGVGKSLVGMAIGSVSVKWQEIDRRAKIAESIALSRFRSRAA